MKKALFILAVLALAVQAQAEMGWPGTLWVVQDGVFQNGWGNSGPGIHWEEGTASAAAGGIPVITVDSGPGWTNLGAPNPQLPIGTEAYLEYLIYFDTTTGRGGYSECMNIGLDGGDGWATKYQMQNCVVITDLGTMADSGVTNMNSSNVMGSDKWLHVSIRLDGGNFLGQAYETVGIIRFGAYPSGIKAYISDMAFTFVPEPATIALLGIGGLALIRRKR